MRCPFCKRNNPAGVAACQVCGAHLLVVACTTCYFENPPGQPSCGGCGESLAEAVAPAPPPGKVYESRQTSPVALIGLGAVVALASVAFPWYLLGAPASPGAVVHTISDLLALGWHWFPGVPLSLIAVGTVISTFLSILAGRGKAHPVACVVVGLVILFSAAWLGLGLQTQTPPATAEAVPASTGYTLTIIGAIVIVASGFWLVRQAANSGTQHPPAA